MAPRSIIAVALQLLTACSFASNASSSYAPRPLGADIAGRRTALVYVSDHTNNLIDVFDRGGSLQYTISSGLNEPAGLSVDAQHNLWVANPGANDVLVFPRGSTDPARTLNDTNQPNDVAVCERRHRVRRRLPQRRRRRCISTGSRDSSAPPHSSAKRSRRDRVLRDVR